MLEDRLKRFRQGYKVFQNISYECSKDGSLQPDVVKRMLLKCKNTRSTFLKPIQFGREHFGKAILRKETESKN